MPRLRDLLLDPRIRNGALDDDELLEAHEHIVREKRLLRSAFLTFYATLTRLCDRYFRVDGLELELGSGAGFFKEVRPGLITSDVRKSPRIDRVIDALAMDIPDDSVRCIYAINVFHHLPSPDTFFLEISRTLRRGGGVIILEPHNGFFYAWL
ncbi:MAG: class I SAM-dependent methyltransferase, partial [Desulfovibrio sp.]|nr:class I SAM-dependent methyltransferase [Desulfovibrio sp.]